MRPKTRIVLTGLALGAAWPLLASRPVEGGDRPEPPGGREAPDPARVPWTASRFAGTPEPPPPYVVEPAFPRLTFDRPVALVHAPGTDRLFVAEVGGKILSFPEDRGSATADLALDLSGHPDGFAALYALAFHPDFARNRLAYVGYVAKNDDPEGTRISRFRVEGDSPPRIDPASETVLLTWYGGGHNGCDLQFGNDGCLYISTGDGAGPTPPDPLDTGQDLSDLLSSVLRIDVDGADPGRAYRVPRDNPFVGLPGARPEVWAYGFRNPWRMSFDRETGDLWVGDVGWELWELIFRVERGGNYGWSVVEGRQPVRPESRRGPTPISPPVVDHPHSEAASITGGYVYRGDRLADLRGAYIYGDYQSGKVWGLRFDREARRVTWHEELADTGLRLVAFGEGAGGELYLVEHERSNQVFRLVPDPTPRAATGFPRRLSETGLFESTRDHRPAPGVVPYAINAESWSDGARAGRLLAIPGEGRIEVDPEGRWRLPEGSVLARTVTLDLAEGDPSSRRRIETQVLHLEDGSWRPYTYVWDDDQADATLADAAGSSRHFEVIDPEAPGGRREHDYRVAARSECLLCHNPWVEARTTVFGRQTASPLAFQAAQLNRPTPDGEEGQVRRLERLGFFGSPLPAGELPRLADPYDESADLDARARAYLHVNCAHCHQFNAGGTATIQLAHDVPLDQAKLVGERPSQGGFGIEGARIVAPGDPSRSVLYYRVSKAGPGRMPRIGSERVDARGSRLLADWIAAMPHEPPGPEADALAALREPRAAPAARRQAVARLLGSTRGALAVLYGIDRGEVAPAARDEVAALAASGGSAEVRDLFERFLPDSERVRRLGDRVDVDALLALPGDPERGRRWFFAESATSCASCHRVGGQGGDLGPELDAIGSKYGPRDLLRHVLEPSREVEERYVATAVATTDGRVVVGRLLERGERDLLLKDARNETVRIELEDVEQEAASPTSLMPEGLLRALTAQQAADLIAFLASLRGAAPASGP